MRTKTLIRSTLKHDQVSGSRTNCPSDPNTSAKEAPNADIPSTTNVENTPTIRAYSADDAPLLLILYNLDMIVAELANGKQM